MKHPGELQLIDLLARATDGRNAAQSYLAIERLVAELLSGQPSAPGGPRRGPDILLPRPDNALVAIELKVLNEASLGKNLANRVASLLAAAVETRRAYRDEATLTAFLLIAPARNGHRGHGTGESMTSAVRRLLRSSDGVGYDSVVVGSVDGGLQWIYYPAASTASPLGAQPSRLGSASEVATALRTQEPIAQRQSTSKRSAGPLRVMLVADEWRSGRGGISTVNRELAIALSGAGVDVAVMVPEADEEDARAASDANVALVTPARVPGLSARETLLLRPVFAGEQWEPDAIIGHGRVLGPFAAAQQQQFFPNARRVHFVHTDAEQLEAAKELAFGASRMIDANARRTLERDLAQSASLVVGIGPLLTDVIQDELIGPGPEARVICIVPGLRKVFDVTSAQAPVANRILIVGRADDFQSKGIDIAAEALLRIVDRWRHSRPHVPQLVIRGVPDEAADAVKERLDLIFERRVPYFLRPYSDAEEAVAKDFAQARLVLMPSRHEGFGLSAYEAIAAGVPVLVSAESGLAQFLRDTQIDSFPSSIVTTRDTATHLATDRWVDAIQGVLDDPAGARESAKSLRTAIQGIVSWERSAAALLKALRSLP